MERVVGSVNKVRHPALHFLLGNRKENLITHQTTGKKLVLSRFQFEFGQHLPDLFPGIIRLYHGNLKVQALVWQSPTPGQKHPAFRRGNFGCLFQMSSSPVYHIKPQGPELSG